MDVPVIDRAHRVMPLSAVQNIYSMVERDSEKGVIPYCMENNIGFVPFSSIASGLLSGKITCHMMTSIDGKIMGKYMETLEGETAGGVF